MDGTAGNVQGELMRAPQGKCAVLLGVQLIEGEDSSSPSFGRAPNKRVPHSAKCPSSNGEGRLLGLSPTPEGISCLPLGSQDGNDCASACRAHLESLSVGDRATEMLSSRGLGVCGSCVCV